MADPALPVGAATASEPRPFTPADLVAFATNLSPRVASHGLYIVVPKSSSPYALHECLSGIPSTWEYLLAILHQDYNPDRNATPPRPTHYSLFLLIRSTSKGYLYDTCRARWDPKPSSPSAILKRDGHNTLLARTFSRQVVDEFDIPHESFHHRDRAFQPLLAGGVPQVWEDRVGICAAVLQCICDELAKNKDGKGIRVANPWNFERARIEKARTYVVPPLDRHCKSFWFVVLLYIAVGVGIVAWNMRRNNQAMGGVF